MTALRILTFNWHEAYLCLLAKTGHSFTVVDQFKGGYRGWLDGTRPIPLNIHLLPVGSEEEARRLARAGSFDLAICHNLNDLAALSGIRIPKIAVFHNMLSTEIALTKAAGRPAPTKAQYVAQFRSVSDDLTRAVFISATKRADAEGIEGRVILPGIDLDEYGGYRGDIPRVLRVGNFFTGRDIMLGQTMAAASLDDLPVTVLGINPEIPGSRLSQSWDDLKEHFRSHRVFLNTTVDGYEDGYNLSMLEAMATGMPVVSLPNRTSPIDEGLNGYVSDQPSGLHDRMKAFLADPLLARKLGARGRDTVASKFPIDRFIREWNDTFDEIARPLNEKQTKVTERDAREIAALEAGARDLVTRGRWSQARSLLEKKLEEYPDAALLWKVLGFAYKNLGREPDAFRAFWAAAKLDPGDAETQKIYLLGLLSIAPGFLPENNPEAAMLACICSGKGIDVGCGPNKTHPGAIGVDLVPAGSPGTAGGVKGLLSVADLCASGDDLHMFGAAELDYVVSRHNLEHYQDPLRALEEWKRVLKPGGILGLVLPDDTNIDSIRLDETHKHVFTPDSFRRLIRYLGDFDVVHIGVCLRNWSFVAILQRQGGSVEPLDYPKALSKAAAGRCRAEAQRREQSGEPEAALECWLEASEIEPGNPEDLRGRIRMLRRLGQLEESEALAAELNARFPNVAKTGASGGSGPEARPAMSRRRILLSCCSNPLTTGTYLERALRKRHDVLTWGPAIDDDIIKAWDLTSVRHRVRPTDLGFESPNVSDALKRWAPGWVPDLFLWIETGVQFPVEGLEGLSCVKACYLIDTHIEFPNDRRVDAHLDWARRFDVVLLAQRAYVERFRAAGLNAHWLPLGCDPEIHKDFRMPRVHPIGFVGTVNHPRRKSLIGQLQSRFHVHMERCFLEEMSRVFSQSQIVFNNAINNDLNMRVFEAMASGALLLTDPAPGSGLEEFFQDGKHLAIYPSDEALVEVAGRWLSDVEAREKAAAAGQAEVLAHHTYDHRVISMEQILFSSPAESRSASRQPGAVDLRTEARALMTTRQKTGFGSGHGSRSAPQAEASLGRGRILLSAGKYDEAEGHFRHWKDEDPTASFAWLGLGCIDLARGRWEDAERNFRLALQISPDEPNALGGLGLALGNSGREMEATDALIRSLKVEPDRVGTLHALVRTAVTVGRFSEALNALKNFMEHERETPELLFSCAALSARQGDAGEALTLLDRVEELEPSYPGLAACRSAWSRQIAPVAELQ